MTQYSDFDYQPTRGTALCQALVLAITAPTDEQAARADELVQQLAYGLSEEEIESAKQTAIGFLEHPENND